MLGLRSATGLFERGLLLRCRGPAMCSPGHKRMPDSCCWRYGLPRSSIRPRSWRGDLRDLFRQPAGSAYEPDVFVAIEALTAACNLMRWASPLAILAPGAPLLRALVGLIGLGLAVKTGAFAILRQAEKLFHWLTPRRIDPPGGRNSASVCRHDAAAPCEAAHRGGFAHGRDGPGQHGAGESYFASTPCALWSQGHFLNFNGLTRLLSSLWPFAALMYLMLLAARQEGEADTRG